MSRGRGAVGMFESHPRKVRVVAITVAVFFVAAFVAVGLLLRNWSTGVHFYVSDQVAMIGIGFVLAAASLWCARPRIRADHTGVEVRNMLGTSRYTWQEIESVSFPDGSPWARLELPDDEYLPILAVQAIDGEHAVTAMRELRRLRREATAAAESQ